MKLFETKGERTRKLIIAEAVHSVLKYGFEGTTVTTITKRKKINRGLVVHYFSTLENLFDECIKSVLVEGALLTDSYYQEFLKSYDPVESYIRANFKWIEQNPESASFYIQLFNRAAYDRKSRSYVQQLTIRGQKKMDQYVKSHLPHQTLKSKSLSETKYHGTHLYHHMMGCLFLAATNPTILSQQLKLSLHFKKLILDL